MQLIPFSHWALAWLCPSASPPIRPAGASSFTAHSSIRLYEPKLAEQNKKKTPGSKFRRTDAKGGRHNDLIRFHRRAFGIFGTSLPRALFAKDSDAQVPDFTVDLAKGCF